MTTILPHNIKKDFTSIPQVSLAPVFNPKKAEKLDLKCGLFSYKYNLYAEPTSSEDTMLNGSYYVLDHRKTKIAVYKPRLQAQGALDHLSGKTHDQRAGIPSGSEAFREELTYFLSEEFNKMITKYRLPIKNFGIPKTKIKTLESTIFGEHHKTGSWQKFKKKYDKLTTIEEVKEIPQDEIIKMAVIDMICLNTDRHLGNLLYSDKKKSLVLIDHGSCFPEFKSLTGLRFMWSLSPHIQKVFPQKWINFILNVDTKKLTKKIILEIEKHQEHFPNEQMEISFEALFILICSIESLKKFAKDTKLCPIEVHTNYLLGGRFARNINSIFHKFCDTYKNTPLCRESLYENFELIKKLISEIL